MRVPGWLTISAAWAWRLLLVTVAVSALAWVLAQLYLVVFPVIVALLLATLLAPPAAFLRRRGWAPALSALVVVGGSVMLLAAVIALLIPPVVSQFGEMGDVLGEGYDQLLDRVGTTFQMSDSEIRDLIDQGISQAQENAGAIGTGLLLGVVRLVEVVAGLLLSTVLLFFFVKDGERITGWIVERTRSEHREDLAAGGRRAWATLGGYLRGTAIIALADALGIGLGLVLIGVPLVIPLMVLIFAGGFFPIIGAFVAGLVGVMVALVAGGIVDALLVLAVVVVVQQIEGNVLEPVVLSRSVPLHPVVIVLAITAGAVIAGVGGAFLAVPVSAVASAVGNELRLRREAAPITA
ncbi:MAG: AI-2E family transporter [Candidatus Rokuibacteriota bacterium]